MSKIKRSVSLYSYQEAVFTGKLDLEGCIREVAKTGATGIELLNEESISTFPVITPEFKENWFSWMEKYGTEPSCMDIFLEHKLYHNRTCTLREQVENMDRDLRMAKELGFKVVRTTCSTPMPTLEASFELAEKYGVKIGLEVHAPFSLNSGWYDGYMDLIHRTGTKYFGFIPDFGMFCRNMPTQASRRALELGAKPDCIKIVDEHYASRVEKGFAKIRYDDDLGASNLDYRKANGFFELMETLKKANAGPEDFAYANRSFTYAWNDPKDITDNIDLIFHTHAKCFHIDEDYNETAVPMQEVIDAYKKGGYDGFLSTEWEGHSDYDDTSDICIEQVRRHQECMRRCIEA